MFLTVASVILGLSCLIHLAIVWRCVSLLWYQPPTHPQGLWRLVSICSAAAGTALVVAVLVPSPWGTYLGTLIALFPFSYAVIPLAGILIAALTGARWN